MPPGIKIGVSTKDPLMFRPFEEGKKEKNTNEKQRSYVSITFFFFVSSFP